MPANIFFPTDHEAKLLTQQKEIVVVRLLKEPPKEGHDLVTISSVDNLAYFYKRDWDKIGTVCDMFKVKLPYPSNVWLDVKETWRFLGCCGDFYRVQYKADMEILKYPALVFGSPFLKFPLLDERWRSPILMPKPAIRSRIKFDVVVKRVSELTMREIGLILNEFIPIGLETTYIPLRAEVKNKFIDHWNITLGHAKPVLTEDGERYEAFPYQGDDYFKTAYIARNTICYSDHAIYKGKRLTIRDRPYVAVGTGVKGEI